MEIYCVGYVEIREVKTNPVRWGKCLMSNIKYVGKDTEKLERGKIHLKEANKTKYGFRADENRER